MNSVKWPCSPWVLIAQWTECPSAVWKVMGSITVGDSDFNLLCPTPCLKLIGFLKPVFVNQKTGKGKESDPTDAPANTSANVSVDCWPTVDRRSTDSRPTVDWRVGQSLTYNVRHVSVVCRWRVGDSFGPYGTFAILNIPFPNWTEMSLTESFH